MVQGFTKEDKDLLRIRLEFLEFQHLCASSKCAIISAGRAAIVYNDKVKGIAGVTGKMSEFQELWS